jgi:hypothetical protein
MDIFTYVALDVHKPAPRESGGRRSASLAESGRGGEVRQIGVFENRPELLIKLAARLSKGGRRLSFCSRPVPAVIICIDC